MPAYLLSLKGKLTLFQPISSVEILAASPTGKAPRPDSYTISYYKIYHNHLASHFTSAFNAIMESHSMPSDLLHTSICVILKPVKDALHRVSYRHISLLNCNLKIVYKDSSQQVGPVLQCIFADQVGFIQSREAWDNMNRSTINVIARARQINAPMILLCIDAETAIDKVHQSFLHEILKNILSRVTALSPQLLLKVTKPFSISNNIRQDCPL